MTKRSGILAKKNYIPYAHAHAHFFVSIAIAVVVGIVGARFFFFVPAKATITTKIRCDLTSRSLTPPVNQFFRPFLAGNKCFYHTRLLQFTAAAVDVRFFLSSHLCFHFFLVWNTTRWAHAHSLTHSVERFNTMMNAIGNFYAATVCVHVCTFVCVYIGSQSARQHSCTI